IRRLRLWLSRLLGRRRCLSHPSWTSLRRLWRSVLRSLFLFLHPANRAVPIQDRYLRERSRCRIPAHGRSIPLSDYFGRCAVLNRNAHYAAMAFRSFHHFLEELERAGELLRIREPVDTELVIAEWANREMKAPGGGKALLFAKPTIDGKTSGFPVAINTMGSRKRIAMALGVKDVGDLAQEIQLILKAKPPTDLREGFALLK